MEGNLQPYNGDWLNFGFNPNCAGGGSGTITWNLTACWFYQCSSNGAISDVCLNVQYTITSAGGGNYIDQYGNQLNLGNQNIAWVPGWSTQLGCLCGGSCSSALNSGNQILSPPGSQGGTTFWANAISVSAKSCCAPQFHYSIPQAKNHQTGSNIQSSSYCQYNNNAAWCGASWSATPGSVCFNPTCPTAQGESLATSGGAIAGYTIAGVIVIGVLVLVVFWNFRTVAKGGHQRTPSNMKDEETVDLSGRPAAPSGATPNTEVTIQTN